MVDRSLTRPGRRAKSWPRVGLLIGQIGLIGLISLWSAVATAEPLVIEARPVALYPEEPERRRMGGLVFLGGLELTSPDHHFGGLSGLSIDPDGSRMLAISDRGAWVGARLIHDSEGRLVGIGAAEIIPLGDSQGDYLHGRMGDAEDIADLANGGYAVSFERRHRVAVYPGDPFMPGNNRGVVLRSPEALIDAPDNKGIEALVEIAPGRLLAVTEGMVASDSPGDVRLRGWLISENEAPAALSYAVTGPLRPTALAKIPGGDLLVLERSFSLIAGLRVRLLRLDAASVAPGATLRPVEIANFGGAPTVDNFEGLAVRRDAQGRLLVYMVSDDNFKGFQRTLLMQFELVY